MAWAWAWAWAWFEQIQKNYLSTEDFNVDRVNNASKACGPLCAWVISQVHYSSILDKVQPLRDEVIRLEEQMVELERQQQISSDVIGTLEASIEQYKKVRPQALCLNSSLLCPPLLRHLSPICAPYLSQEGLLVFWGFQFVFVM